MPCPPWRCRSNSNERLHGCRNCIPRSLLGGRRIPREREGEEGGASVPARGNEHESVRKGREEEKGYVQGGPTTQATPAIPRYPRVPRPEHGEQQIGGVRCPCWRKRRGRKHAEGSVRGDRLSCSEGDRLSGPGERQRRGVNRRLPSLSHCNRLHRL